MSRPRARLMPRPAMTKVLIEAHGRGGEKPGTLGPGSRIPSSPAPAAPSFNPLQGLTDGISAGIRQVTASTLGGGQVLIGVALILGGLLVATGQAGRVVKTTGKAGVFAASRGTVRL